MYKVLHCKAFTLLEVIFVMVILGIVASIGSGIIVNAYENYLMQRSIHSASIKTELAINQLANRLSYYIKPSLLARQPGTTNLANALPLDQVSPGNNTHRALEWIGYENDGFSATTAPAWSGVCDLAASNFSTLTTPGSRLNVSTAAQPSELLIVNNLGFNGLPAIKFIAEKYRTGANYTTLCMYGGAAGCMFPVNITGDTTLTFTGGGDRIAGAMIYSEFYQLAGSAYAVVPVTPGTVGGAGNYGATLVGGVPVWDLRLHYNYQPWQGENYLNNGVSQLLLHNVSVFRFKQEGDTIRIKLCTVEQTDLAQTISICKEKAVLR